MQQKFRNIIEDIVRSDYQMYFDDLGIYNNRAVFRIPFISEIDAECFAKKIADKVMSKGVYKFVLDVRYYDQYNQESDYLRKVYGMGERAPEIINGGQRNG